MTNTARLMKSDEFNAVFDRPHCSKPVKSADCKPLPALRNEQDSREIIQPPFTPIHNEILVDKSMEELTRKLSFVVVFLSLFVFVLFSFAPAV